MTNMFRHIDQRKPTDKQLLNYITQTRGRELSKFKMYRQAIKDGKATVRDAINQLRNDAKWKKERLATDA